jgi:hypothetical protein
MKRNSWRIKEGLGSRREKKRGFRKHKIEKQSGNTTSLRSQSKISWIKYSNSLISLTKVTTML